MQKIGRSSIFKCDWDTSLANLNPCLEAYKEIHCDPSAASTLYALGVCLHLMNDHQQALFTFTECRRIIKNIIPQDTAMLGNLHFWAGQQYLGLGENLKASKRLISALRIYKENRSSVGEKVVVETLHLLGQAHTTNKLFNLGLKCFNEEVLIFGSSSIKYSNTKIAEAHYCAGKICVEIGDFDRAKDCFEKSIEVLNVDSGEKSERLAKSLEELGAIHSREKDFAEAITLLTQAKRMYRNVLGSSHPSTALSNYKLGQAFLADSQFQQAKQCFKECLLIRISLLGSDHQDVADTQFALGKATFSLSETNEAIYSFQEVS